MHGRVKSAVFNLKWLHFTDSFLSWFGDIKPVIKLLDDLHIMVESPLMKNIIVTRQVMLPSVTTLWFGRIIVNLQFDKIQDSRLCCERESHFSFANFL